MLKVYPLSPLHACHEVTDGGDPLDIWGLAAVYWVRVTGGGPPAWDGWELTTHQNKQLCYYEMLCILSVTLWHSPSNGKMGMGFWSWYGRSLHRSGSLEWISQAWNQREAGRNPSLCLLPTSCWFLAWFILFHHEDGGGVVLHAHLFVYFHQIR
jgi:hypothetical protein